MTADAHSQGMFRATLGNMQPAFTQHAPERIGVKHMMIIDTADEVSDTEVSERTLTVSHSSQSQRSLPSAV